MDHKLYLNGQYLKTVKFPGFPPGVHWMFDIGECEAKYVRSYCYEKDCITIFFHGVGVRGIEGYYGIIDKKTEKKIRRL